MSEQYDGPELAQKILRQQARIAVLKAELASQLAWKERYMREMLESSQRIAALEAALCRAIGIERDQIDDVLYMTAGTNSVSVSSKSASETDVKRMPPREFDIESHQGLYTQTVAKPVLSRTANAAANFCEHQQDRYLCPQCSPLR